MSQPNSKTAKTSHLGHVRDCAFVTAMIFAISAAGAAKPARQTSSDKFTKPPVEILTPHDGVDFTAFVNNLVSAVKGNWYAHMPDQVRRGDKGTVRVRFKIQQDGALAQAPSIDASSGAKPLDDAAVEAIRASTSFDHLPSDFKGPAVELRVTFYYNQPPPEQQP